MSEGHDTASSRPPTPGGAALRWWRAHLDVANGRDRALRARLRRADAPVDILANAEVIALAAELGLREPERLALVAQALASIDADTREHAAQRFGEGEPKALSPARFEHLRRATRPEDLRAPLRRALPLIGRRCNVAALADDLLRWDDRVRMRWCFEYFGGRGTAIPKASGDAPEGRKEDVA